MPCHAMPTESAGPSGRPAFDETLPAGIPSSYSYSCEAVAKAQSGTMKPLCKAAVEELVIGGRLRSSQSLAHMP